MTYEMPVSGTAQKDEKNFSAAQISKMDWMAALILFAFPLFAVSVRHWASASFFLLCLLGIFFLAIKRKEIFKDVSAEEWVLVGLIVTFFCSFLLTSFSIGWDEQAERALGTELRFLLFVPLYFFVRRNFLARRALVLGSFAAVFINFGFVFYEVEYLHREQVHLVYSSLYVGPVTVIFAAISVFGFRVGGEWPRFFVRMLLVAVAFYVAAHTSRSAIIGVLLLGGIAIALLQRRFRCITFMFFVALVLGAIMTNEFAQKRIVTAYHELINYMQTELDLTGDTVNRNADGSIGTRLEMIKSSFYVLKISPWVGLGRYHFTEHVKSLSDSGEVYKSASHNGHPHNIFMAALIFKGLVGLIALCGMLFYALAFLWHKRVITKDGSLVGVAFLLVLIATQLTESAAIIKGNFIALLLIGVAVFFSSAATSRKERILSE
jgi:O-antigen ligase